jgi:hypothetical protein
VHELLRHAPHGAARARVVRCVRRLVARTRDGLAITVALGELARSEASFARQWPSYFGPSVA